MRPLALRVVRRLEKLLYSRLDLGDLSRVEEPGEKSEPVAVEVAHVIAQTTAGARAVRQRVYEPPGS